ncbi:sulfotransferase [Bradyrhizobium guangzhouense]|uniref:sulfotransferase n=1 Tax=Bradyrhizobium guangzhouense TaxID=1325095 RepID=UPI001009D519|nr:sulfotransferase [Bradyrhizobium guangzhouense]RXH16963.1 sulfotransferase [Bradyrhizobium guangzhouense]
MMGTDMIMKVRHVATAADGVNLFAVIDGPKIGESTEAPCIELTGWAVHASQQFREIRAIGKYVDVRAMRYPRPGVVSAFKDRFAVNEYCGFYVHLWACDIADDPHIEVQAITEDGATITIAQFEIDATRPSRSQFYSSETDVPAILIVSNVGRSGSSLLMGSLLKHPSVVGSRSPSYESHLIQGHVARLKLEIMYTYPMVYFYRPWYNDDIRGMELYGITRSELPTVQPFLINQHMENFSKLVSSYARDVLSTGNRTDVFVCEKATQPAQRDVARFLSWYWPRYREIVLVRDPRDLICSYVAFDAARGIEGRGFSEGLQTNPEAFFERIGRSYQELALRVSHSGPSLMVVTYESLILEPRTTMRRICDWLGIDNSHATMEALLNKSDLQFEMGAKHVTSGDPRETIGRWKRDLPQSYLPLIDKYVRDAATFFGYLESR